MNKPSYEVTIRDSRGDKIAHRIDVDEASTTLAEILEQAAYTERMEDKKLDFRRLYHTDNYREWFVAVVPPPPPPPPEPLGFDVLVDQWSV